MGTWADKIRCQGYPRPSSSDDTDWTVIEAFTCDYYPGIIADLPQIGSLYEDFRCNEDKMTNVGSIMLTKRELERSAGGDKWTVTLTFAPENVVNAMNQMVGKPIYTSHCQSVEKPLTELVDYRKKWDHCLIGKLIDTTKDETDPAKKVYASPAVPSWWSDADKDYVITGADCGNYRWVKDRGDVPDGWTVLKMRTKTAEARLYGSTIVTETIYFARAEDVGKVQRQVSSRQEPAKKFGRVGGDWLLIDVDCQPEGKKWRVTKQFQFADEWDSDLYKVTQ